MFHSLTQSGRLRQFLSRKSSCANALASYSYDNKKRTSTTRYAGDIKKENVSQKRPPDIPHQDECCGTGCSDCVFLKYAEKLVDYYKDGGALALKEIEKIPDASVRVFVQTELKFYLALDKEMRERIKESRKEPSIGTVQTQD